MSLIWCFTDSTISSLLFKFLNKTDLLTCRSISWEMWESIPLIKILPGIILHQSKSITCWLSKEENAAAKVLTTWYGRLHKRQFQQRVLNPSCGTEVRLSVMTIASLKMASATGSVNIQRNIDQLGSVQIMPRLQLPAPITTRVGELIMFGIEIRPLFLAPSLAMGV